MASKTTIMKGVSIIRDETRRKRYVQIDISLIEKDPELVEDVLDVIIAESRRNEPTITLEEFERRLKKRYKR